MRNKYPGICHKCGDPVDTDKGYVQKNRGGNSKWLTKCVQCVIIDKQERGDSLSTYQKEHLKKLRN